MDISIRSDGKAKRLTIEIRDIDWEGYQGGDFYQGEGKVQEMVASIGRELTKSRHVGTGESGGNGSAIRGGGHDVL